jgi:hypothetical protein
VRNIPYSIAVCLILISPTEKIHACIVAPKVSTRRMAMIPYAGTTRFYIDLLSVIDEVIMINNVI